MVLLFCIDNCFIVVELILDIVQHNRRRIISDKKWTNLASEVEIKKKKRKKKKGLLVSYLDFKLWPSWDDEFWSTNGPKLSGEFGAQKLMLCFSRNINNFLMTSPNKL